MNGKTLAKLTAALDSRSWIEKSTVRGIFVIASALAVYSAWETYLGIRWLENLPDGGLWGITISYSMLWLRVRIATALAVNSLLVWGFKAKALMSGVLPLLWVAGEGVLWFVWSLRLRNSLGIGRLPESSVPGLYRSEWPDAAVLALTFALMLWAAKVLLLCWRSSSEPPGLRVEFDKKPLT